MAVRMNILLDIKHKKLLKKLADDISSSESEVIRRALDAYDPQQGQHAEEIGVLLRALQAANQQARVALQRAEKEVEHTLAYYQAVGAPHSEKQAINA
ncbi:MAG: hypothetical protein OEW08_03305 [Gammaproteobacteria bacterium]|nr:hypothetical protein [Gammaproteobacteria bacterium]